MRKWTIAVGNAHPANYEVMTISAKTRNEALFQAGLRCAGHDDWHVLSVDYWRPYKEILGYQRKN
ncbi:MAG: hypothetical protein LBM93_15185 [Oscillospiraceae bacterium]|jgi:hypothetical protein|nr:hypothetical protein [Oscillospiraceae bacterium]